VLGMLGIAGVYGDVPDAALTLPDDVHRPDIAPASPMVVKTFPKTPVWFGYSILKVTL
jgi:hypothetical protein